MIEETHNEQVLFNGLNNLQPPFEVSEKTKAEFKLINKEIFEDEIVKSLVDVKPVDNPIFLNTFLDMQEVDSSIKDLSTDNTLETQLDKSPSKQIGLVVKSQCVEVSTYQVSSTMHHEQIMGLKEIGIDAMNITTNVLVQEVKQGLIKNIINEVNKIGEQAWQESYTDEDNKRVKKAAFIKKYVPFLAKWLPKYFKDSYFKYYEIDNSKSLLAKILSHSNIIAAKGRFGTASYAIVNGHIATILQDMPGFECKPMTSLNTTGIPYDIGKIGGLQIIVDPNKRWDDLSVLLGYKLKNNTQGIGVCYMPESLAIQTITEATMTPKISLRLRYACTFLGNKERATNLYQKIYFKFTKSLI